MEAKDKIEVKVTKVIKQKIKSKLKLQSNKTKDKIEVKVTKVIKQEIKSKLKIQSNKTKDIIKSRNYKSNQKQKIDLSTSKKEKKVMICKEKHYSI